MGVPKDRMPMTFNKSNGDQAVSQQEAKASGKAKARYPHKQYPNDLCCGSNGSMGRRANTPGTTPTGS